MENASKALLITAAVLIVIIIVALGVKLLGGVSDTSKQANEVGTELSKATNNQMKPIILYEIKSCYGEYTNKDKACKAYRNIIDNIRKYNEVRGENEPILSLQTEAAYMSSEGFALTTGYDTFTQKGIELIVGWFLDGNNKITIREGELKEGKQVIIFDFGTCKNHNWQDIFDYDVFE